MSKQRIGDVAEVLLDYVEQGQTYQGDKIMTVPAAIYMDAGQRDAEMQRIFRSLPLMLALSCEIPKPGDYKAMDVVGLPILITRDKTAKVRAFFNVCAHRWAPVAAEGRGNCLRLICPFHGWTYGLDGKLISISDAPTFGSIDKFAHGLRELPCEERHGMIFVGLTPGMRLELDEYYGALLNEYAEAGLADWTFLGSRVIEAGNWKITLNNFFESYHFATLHRKTVAVDFACNTSHYEGFGPHMRIALVQRSIGKLRELPRAQWGEQEGKFFGFIRFFFPNVTGFLTPELSLFSQSFPGATPDKSRTVFLFLRKHPPKDEAEREKIEELINDARNAENEDFGIGVQVQKALESGAHEGLLYGRNERGNQYFHEWLSWYLQADSALPRPCI